MFVTREWARTSITLSKILDENALLLANEIAHERGEAISDGSRADI